MSAAAGSLAFLTGATGFIGSRLAGRLAARGYRLRCLARPGSRTAALRELGAELVEAELTDAGALAEAMAGAALAYHLAAIYDLGVVDRRALERTNVGGTAAFLEAAERAGVPRVVYVSTTLALGHVPDGVGDEETEHRGEPESVYERTKVEAHRLARAAQARGAPVIIACPANVYGPDDPGPSGRFIEDLLRHRVPGLPLDPTWFSYVHVDDVAEGLALLAERGRTGETYVLSGEDATLNDFARRALAEAGKRPPPAYLPTPVARLTGSLMDAVSRALDIRLPVTRETAALSTGGRLLHSHAKATRELDWHPRPLSAGLPGTVASLRERLAGARRR